MDLKRKKLITLSYNAALNLKVLEMVSGLSSAEVIRQVLIEVGFLVGDTEKLTGGYLCNSSEELGVRGFIEILKENPIKEDWTLEQIEEWKRETGAELRAACCTKTTRGRKRLPE